MITLDLEDNLVNMVGERITLKAVNEEDLVFVMELFNDPITGETVAGWAPPVSRFRQREWFAEQATDDSTLRYTVWDNQGGQPVGMVTFTGIDRRNRTAEFHIRLHHASTRKGFGFEASRQMLRVGFDYMDLALIYAKLLPTNDRSQRMFDRLGFQHDGVLRSRLFKHGKRHDLVVCSITAEEYRRSLGGESQ